MPHPARPLLRAFGMAGAAAVLSACGPPAPQAPYWNLPPQAQQGRVLLAQYQCGSCHRIPEVDAAQGLTGPPLDAYGRRSYIAGHVPNSPEALARWIVDPAAMSPGTPMPAMGVSAPDAAAMAAFLHALR